MKNPCKNALMGDLNRFVVDLASEKISENREETLQTLVDYIQLKIDSKSTVKLHFICTHNSRRSQLAQIWAQTMAYHFGLEIYCFSGGVEVTAFNESAVKTLIWSGFEIQKNEIKDNPVYMVFYAKEKSPIRAFSKLVDDAINPSSGFAAIMTCTHADENCPVVHGAEMRIPVRYDDPKAFDDTPEEDQKYKECSKQIASEMYWVFSRIKF